MAEAQAQPRKMCPVKGPDANRWDMGTNNPIEAARITYTIKGCIARSTFLAGFTYYELGRNDFQQHYDIAYVVLNTAGFCFAVLSVGIGTLTLYYLERCKSGEQKIAFVDRANDVYVPCDRIQHLIFILVQQLGRYHLV